MALPSRKMQIKIPQLLRSKLIEFFSKDDVAKKDNVADCDAGC